MTIESLRIAGYRSIRSIRLPIGRLSVFVGPNGSGKSNLYRAMVLLAAAARGGLAQALAEEGGMPSALWAGPRRKGPVRVALGVDCPPFSYELQLGLPRCTDAAFPLDPIVKQETIALSADSRRVRLLERAGPAAWLRDRAGKRLRYDQPLLMPETALAQLRDPTAYPEQTQLRDELAAWRFYHHFRTDLQSPIRQPQVGVVTPTLSSDGGDLAATLRTAGFLGDDRDIHAAVDAAFPGAGLEIHDQDGRFALKLRMPGIQRPFDARELSDGTLRYLCLIGALMSYRLPAFVALNEPEMSLHPDLLEPLARLIAEAAQRTQIWVVTHSQTLAEQLERYGDCTARRVQMVDGETRIEGLSIVGRFDDEEDADEDLP
jgi:predicted ATPase